ncbi:hypothetical protein QIS99_09005 [Streptomyces sp. B-S-A8]|uniref:HNH endonuclease n=2 Tax=Streptomyces TaxID=1883 RepID=A0ABT6S319_9ACTN|nr:MULTISPECIES: hypothetical protein [unclassified Streptomyces]MDI3386352.1 hypothetical protein [Streptomyces sp. B-S-A8]MDI3402486.1 hypothetical protein [Streptomyces sp. B-S-A6]
MATTKHKTTPEPVIELPIGFEAWLLDCVPVPLCGVCAANHNQMTEAREKGDIRIAARHASEIRSHASGAHDRA